MKVDVVIPTRNRNDIRPNLLSYINGESSFGKLIIIEGLPTSQARKAGCQQAQTEVVALFDDDMEPPKTWLLCTLEKILDKKVGAVTTVHSSTDKDVIAYTKIVAMFVNIVRLDTTGRIGNTLIKRSLLKDYKPTPLSNAEEMHLVNYIKSIGYTWLMLPDIGVKHMRRSTITTETGINFHRLKIYSKIKLLRRVSARFLFGIYTPAISHTLKTPFSLWRDEIQFIAGWLKDMANR